MAILADGLEWDCLTLNPGSITYHVTSILALFILFALVSSSVNNTEVRILDLTGL
jgi:hypothetical protein